MIGLGDESDLTSIKSIVQRIDVGAIDVLKNEVEFLITQKKEND